MMLRYKLIDLNSGQKIEISNLSNICSLPFGLGKKRHTNKIALGMVGWAINMKINNSFMGHISSYLKT